MNRCWSIGIPRGVIAPTAADFGNPDHLFELGRNHAAAIVPWSFALAGPYLALPVALGWYQMLRHTGGFALLAVVMFYVTMTFSLTGEAVRLALLLELPPAYVGASESARVSLLAFGGTMNALKETLFTLGQMLGFGLGLLLFGVALLRSGTMPRWLGWLALVPAILIGWVATLMKISGVPLGIVGPVTGLGFLLFFLWVGSMAVVLFPWQPHR